MLKYKIPQIVTLTRKSADPNISSGVAGMGSFCAKNKNPLQNIFVEALCDRDRIQTCNRLIRSQLLYSVELRDLYY